MREAMAAESLLCVKEPGWLARRFRGVRRARVLRARVSVCCLSIEVVSGVECGLWHADLRHDHVRGTINEGMWMPETMMN